MKRFTSPLQVVQTIRVRREQTALEQYAQALQEREKIARQLSMLQAEKERLAARWKQLVGQPLCTAGELQHHSEWSASLAADEEKIGRQLAEREGLVQEMLRRVMAARREREAIDKFLETQRMQYQRELSRAEQKILDELGGNRTGKRSWNAQ